LFHARNHFNIDAVTVHATPPPSHRHDGKLSLQRIVVRQSERRHP